MKLSEEANTNQAFEPSRYLTKLGPADYLEVKWRLVWFRHDHPDGVIATTDVALTDKMAVFKASVSIPGGGSSTAFGSETRDDFKDYVEKAETKAVGRALAALGYGTQFTPDFDFGADKGRVVDSPVQRPRVDTSGEPASKAQVDLVTRGLTKAGFAAQGYLDDLYPQGLTKGQATEILTKLKSGELAPK